MSCTVLPILPVYGLSSYVYFLEMSWPWSRSRDGTVITGYRAVQAECGKLNVMPPGNRRTYMKSTVIQTVYIQQ